MHIKDRPYFENMDALRFVAAMMVVFSHIATAEGFPVGRVASYVQRFLSLDGEGGDEGVRFFFVLSGFLITYLMHWESKNAESFSVGNFYVRRILRIWPLYFGILLFGFVIYPQINAYYQTHNGNPWWYLFFLANFDQLQTQPAPVLGVLWSVAIEEQFYLFWPLLFVATARGRLLPWICLICLTLSVVHIISGGVSIHTLAALLDLSTGALAASACYNKPERIARFFQWVGRWGAMFIYAAGVLMLFLTFWLNHNVPWFHFVERPLHALFFAFIIVDQNFSNNSPFKVGSLKSMSHFGKISYGIYMLHALALLIAAGIAGYLGLNFYLMTLLGLVLTFVLSELSYRYFETYFLNLKKRFLRTGPN